MDEIHHRARRICLERGMTTLADLQLIDTAIRVRRYHDAIEPFIKMKVDMLMVKLPRITLFADGKMETNFDWTPAELETIKELDRCIAYEATRLGLNEPLRSDN